MLEIIKLGGPVMIPLLLCSVFALAIGIERLWYLLRCRIDTEELMEEVSLSLGQGKLLEAMQIAKKARGPVAAVLAAGIAHYDKDPKLSVNICRSLANRKYLKWSGASVFWK